MIFAPTDKSCDRFVLVSLVALCFTISLSTSTLTPIKTDLLEATNASLLWGPYRPNLYIGVRPRISNSMSTGLMWSQSDDAVSLRKNLRHTCEQDEGMAGYGWAFYDPRIGGSQTILDTINKVDITVAFVKPRHEEASSWALRVKGNVRADGQQAHKTTIIFYIGVEAPDSHIQCIYPPKDPDRLHEIICSGHLNTLPDFEISFSYNTTQVPTKEMLPSVAIHTLQVPEDQIWQAKPIFLTALEEVGNNIMILPNQTSTGNLAFIQTTFRGDFSMDIAFGSSSLPFGRSMMLKTLTESLQFAKTSFYSRFKAVYQPQSPFTNQHHVKFSQELLANLLGGIGFFHGSSKVSTDAIAEKSSLATVDANVEERGPYDLFSAVPSRPFFPRGFLWDEGFHLQIISEWDIDLALDILTSWFDMMDDNGWIAREQILGSEARSKVPPEFQTQYQLYANPPTMFLVIDMFVDMAFGSVPYNGAPSQYVPQFKGNIAFRTTEKAKTFLQQLYPKMLKHYLWFRRTQAGSLENYQHIHSTSEKDYSEGYRWRGRTSQHVLTSGLDDYPRAPEPSKDELHLDALCWVSLMAQVLEKVSNVMETSDNSTKLPLALHIAEAARVVNDLHWSESNQAFCDLSIVQGNVEHICHKGYISLLPLLTNTMSNPTQASDRVSAILDLISSPSHLWSSFGLRSLSMQDNAYGTGENYWRSPIWINFNYLVLRSLLKLVQDPETPLRERATTIYTELRKNVVSTVFRSWRETGFAWEQYNPDTGAGQRTQHFTGWTALIVRIMAMPDLADLTKEFSVNRQPFTGFNDSLAPNTWIESWTSRNIVLVLMSMLLFSFLLLFKRRLVRSWKAWLDDRWTASQV